MLSYNINAFQFKYIPRFYIPIINMISLKNFYVVNKIQHNRFGFIFISNCNNDIISNICGNFQYFKCWNLMLKAIDINNQFSISILNSFMYVNIIITLICLK